MRTLLRFSFLLVLKLFSRIFWRYDWAWVGPPPARAFAAADIGIFLNHTSLFEPIFLGPMPFDFLWKLDHKGVFPGADVTLKRPIAGRLFRLIAADTVAISRKRDGTWDSFLSLIGSGSFVLIAPEGRMKRRNGLDKEGRPMTVRAGIVDVLMQMGKGTMVFCYSGGLHHIHAPGDKFPRLFQTARIRYEALQIDEYLKSFGELEKRELRRKVVADMEARRDQYIRYFETHPQ